MDSNNVSAESQYVQVEDIRGDASMAARYGDGQKCSMVVRMSID